ncbi:MAG: polyketide synthase dehydratase domain-containing protein, partial [Myxococcota bacterium]
MRPVDGADDTIAAATETWLTHASATLRGQTAPTAETPTIAELKARCPDELSSDQEIYQTLWNVGAHLGPGFRWVQKLWRGAGQAIASIERPRDVPSMDTLIHPAQLDSCIQVLAALMQGEDEPAYLPFSIAHVRFFGRPGDRLWCHATRVEGPDNEIRIGNLRLLDDNGRLIAEIERIALKRATPRNLLAAQQRNWARWTYQVAWRRQSVPAGEGREAPQQGRWLVFTDSGDVGRDLARRIGEAGGHCLMVSPGREFVEEAPDHYRIDPSDRDHVSRLLDSLSEVGAIDGAIYLWALDAPDGDIEAAAELTCAGALHVARSLALRPAGFGPCRLWLVTRDAQSIPTDSADCAAISHLQAPLWGLGRVIMAEHPELSCRLVDIDGEPDSDAAGRLMTELVTGDDENQIAYRHGERLIARLERHPLGNELSAQLSLSASKSYLVTGGMGALGLHVAEWLVDRGA